MPRPPGPSSLPASPASRAPDGHAPRLRGRLLLLFGASSLAAAVLLFGMAPVARSVLLSRARARGLDVEVDRVSLGLGTLRLGSVTIRAHAVPGFEMNLAEVEVAPSLTLSVRRLDAHGGRVRLQGTPADLERRFSALRSRAQASPTQSSVGPRVSIDGIDVVWSFGGDGEARDVGDEAHVWGLRYERAPDGHERFGADLVRLALAGSRVDVARPSAASERAGDHRAVTALAAAGMTAILDVDALLPRLRDTAPGGGPSGAEHTGAPPREAPPDPSRGPRVLERLRALGAKVEGVLPVASKTELTDARFVLRHAGETLNVGPATIVLERDRTAVRLAVTSAAREESTPLALEATVPLAAGPVDVVLSGGPLRLSALGIEEGDMGLLDVDRAEVELGGHARLAEDGRSLSFSGQSRLSDLSLFQPKLARDPVRGLRLGLSGEADVSLDGSHIALGSVSLSLGHVTVKASGSLDRGEGWAKAALHVEVPLAACSDMLGSTPPALVPLLSGLRMSGTFALAGDVAFDSRRPAETRVDFLGANGCRVLAVPDGLSPERFRRPFPRSVLGADGQPTTVESGPGAPDWVPLFDVSPFVATAVVVCEDAHFFTHDGFDGKSLQDSIRDDLKAGKFARGGSTVSMQLAKNLYLAREKTLSRKLQEAVLTLLLEQTLGKEAILELYLNVVELGPGLYGIGPAARHYFHVEPKDLSLGQALYLVSLLPNPKAHHFRPDGTLTDAWADYLRHLMDIAHKIHRVTDAELAAGLAETVRLGVAAGQVPAEDPPEGSAGPDVVELAPRGEENAEGP